MEPKKGNGLSASRGPGLKLSLDPVLCSREQRQQAAGSWKDLESSPKLPDLWESYANTQTQLYQATWGVLQCHCEGARGTALG